MGCKNSPPSRTLAAYLVDQMPDEDVPKMCSVLAHMEDGCDVVLVEPPQYGKKMPVTYDGGYGRQGTVKLMQDECAACRQERRCLVLDSSEGEYNPGAICQTCANTLFAAYKEPQCHDST